MRYSLSNRGWRFGGRSLTGRATSSDGRSIDTSRPYTISSKEVHIPTDSPAAHTPDANPDYPTNNPDTRDECFQVFTQREQCFSVFTESEACFYIDTYSQSDPDNPTPPSGQYPPPPNIDLYSFGAEKILAIHYQATALFVVADFVTYENDTETSRTRSLMKFDYTRANNGGIYRINRLLQSVPLSDFDVNFDVSSNLVGYGLSGENKANGDILLYTRNRNLSITKNLVAAAASSLDLSQLWSLEKTDFIMLRTSFTYYRPFFTGAFVDYLPYYQHDTLTRSYDLDYVHGNMYDENDVLFTCTDGLPVYPFTPNVRNTPHCKVGDYGFSFGATSPYFTRSVVITDPTISFQFRGHNYTFPPSRCLELPIYDGQLQNHKTIQFSDYYGYLDDTPEFFDKTLALRPLENVSSDRRIYVMDMTLTSQSSHGSSETVAMPDMEGFSLTSDSTAIYCDGTSVLQQVSW